MHNADGADEPALHQLRAEFPAIDALRTSSGMNYAKHEGSVIAADLSTGVMREQIRAYFQNQGNCRFCGAKIKRAGGDRWLLADVADVNGYCPKGDDDQHHPEIEEETTDVVERKQLWDDVRGRAE
jgi:hypothetical protein